MSKSRASLEGTVDALAFAGETIAASLRAARAAGGLTQAQLAEKLGRSETLVARAESGKLRVGADYVDAVLKACGLPADWSAADGAPKRRAIRAKKRRKVT